jgi:hypothetical protein
MYAMHTKVAFDDDERKCENGKIARQRATFTPHNKRHLRALLVVVGATAAVVVVERETDACWMGVILKTTRRGIFMLRFNVLRI